LFAYWWFSHGWLLEPLEELPETGIQEPFLRDVHESRQAQRAMPLWRRLTIWRR